MQFVPKSIKQARLLHAFEQERINRHFTEAKIIMISALNNSVSALQAFTQQINTSANNVANSLSDEFKASRTRNIEGENGGVTTYTTKDNSSGPLVEDPLKNDGSLKELSNTDIAEEFVQQISAQNGYEANAKTIKTVDETIGSVIDIIG